MILFRVEVLLFVGCVPFRLGARTCVVSHNSKKQKVKVILVNTHNPAQIVCYGFNVLVRHWCWVREVYTLKTVCVQSQLQHNT